MNTILFQNLQHEILSGLVNSAQASQNRIVVADLSEGVKHKPDVVIVFDSNKVGYKSFSFKKGTKLIFVNCEPPDFVKKKEGVQTVSLNHFLCVDTHMFPVGEPTPYSCDILVALDTPLEIYSELSELARSHQLWIIGKKFEHPNYIGFVDNPTLVSLALQSKMAYTSNFVLNKTLQYYGVPLLQDLSPDLKFAKPLDGLVSYDEEWKKIDEQISTLHS
jgi:hypothetical protein